MTSPRQGCPGCGLSTDAVAGPAHAYIGASPGCWQRYGELLAQGRGEQLAVDTYAVQHPGVEERRSVQSVAVHLMSMAAVLERGVAVEDTVDLIRRMLAGPREWYWLTLEPPIGTVTVDDVLAGRMSVHAWTEDVWAAWAPYHGTVRAWLDVVSA